MQGTPNAVASDWIFLFTNEQDPIMDCLPIVVDSNKVLNEGGLRNEKEFVNHKILDLAGDFLLSGYRVLGKVTCYQGGHELTNKFLRKLLNQKSSIRTIEMTDKLVSKKTNSNQFVNIAVNA